MTKEGETITMVKAIINIFLKPLEAYERVKVCESCDKYFLRAKICSVCKCFIPAKSRLRHQTCPEDKWENIDKDA